jgi:hypothetical protein
MPLSVSYNRSGLCDSLQPTDASPTSVSPTTPSPASAGSHYPEVPEHTGVERCLGPRDAGPRDGRAALTHDERRARTPARPCGNYGPGGPSQRVKRAPIAMSQNARSAASGAAPAVSSCRKNWQRQLRCLRSNTLPCRPRPGGVRSPFLPGRPPQVAKRAAAPGMELTSLGCARRR